MADAAARAHENKVAVQSQCGTSKAPFEEIFEKQVAHKGGPERVKTPELASAGRWGGGEDGGWRMEGGGGGENSIKTRNARGRGHESFEKLNDFLLIKGTVSGSPKTQHTRARGQAGEVGNNLPVDKFL